MWRHRHSGAGNFLVFLFVEWINEAFEISDSAMALMVKNLRHISFSCYSISFARKSGCGAGSNCMTVHLGFRFHSQKHSFSKFLEWNSLMYSWVLQNLYDKEMNQVTQIITRFRNTTFETKEKAGCVLPWFVSRASSLCCAGGGKMILTLLSLGHNLIWKPRLWTDKKAIFLQFWICEFKF